MALPMLSLYVSYALPMLSHRLSLCRAVASLPTSAEAALGGFAFRIARDPRLKMRENHVNHGAFESSGSDASFGGGEGAGGAAVRARQGEQESDPEDADSRTKNNWVPRSAVAKEQHWNAQPSVTACPLPLCPFAPLPLGPFALCPIASPYSTRPTSTGRGRA